MYFQIKELILWPRTPGFSPRRLRFEPGMVNIISGVSRTGKSAIIPIIDYCLGSKTCGIPTETIRKACAWFGIIVTNKDTDRLFARREPELQRATDDMMLLEGLDLVVPDRPTKNATADGVRRMLDEISGLSNLDFGDEGGAFSGRVSFRDLAAFNFQPQNVIANPEVLFFKTDSYEHREKLRTIFPYVLGAVTPDILAKQHELRRLQQILKRKARELEQTQQVSARWLATLQVRIAEGRELGLIQQEIPTSPTNDELIAILEKVISRTDATVAVSSATIDQASRETSDLEREEGRLSSALSVLRQRLIEMNRVRDSAGTYAGALKVQRGRLKIAEWLSEHTPTGCPVCGGDQAPAGETLAELTSSLVVIEDSLKDFNHIPATFDRELQRVKTEVSERSDQLEAVRIRHRALAQRSDGARADHYRASQAARFIGNTENALELYRRVGHDSELREEVEKLSSEIAVLQAQVREDEIANRTRRALSQVNSNASRILPMLDAERPDVPIELDIRDLTIKIIGTERTDFLSEVGSGSNWLSYHVSMLLGLHSFFLKIGNSPVPSFLVIDQPSQVYFPRKLAVRKNEELEEPKLSSDADIEAVKKIFGAIGSAIGAAAGGLQAIILDHAPESVWGNQPHLWQAAEWRDGSQKLVPIEWLG